MPGSERCTRYISSIYDMLMYIIRPSTVAVSGKYLVMETPDTFGGEKFVRIDTLSFIHVTDVSIGYSAHSSVADFPVSAHQNKSLSSVHGSSPSIDLQQRVPNQTFMNQGLLNKPVAPTNPPSRRGSGANNSVSQRVTISYIKPPAKEIRAMILQSVQSVQLHSMLRYFRVFGDAISN